MFTIRIQDLEVFYRVGVPDEERAEPHASWSRLRWK